MSDSTSKAIPPTPFLLVIEGIDGAGKTTLAASMTHELRRCGFRTFASKEPTQGEFGKQLRDSAATGRLNPTQELALLLADRQQHVNGQLRPALAGGSIVVLDRYYYSNAAYQGAVGLNPATILETNESFAPRPDLVLLLDVAPEVGLARIRSRGDFANAFERPDTLTKCRAIFRSLTRPEIKTIDASMSALKVLSEAMQHFVVAFTSKVKSVHGLTPEGIEALRPLLKDAFGQSAITIGSRAANDA